MKKSMLYFIVIALIILSACNADADNAQDDTNFNFGAATQGGFWYTLAAAMGEEITTEFEGSNVNIVEGGSISNLIAINEGQFQLGFATGQDIPNALEGNAPFEEKLENISWVSTLYPSVFQIVVREDSGIETIEDLKGKRVSPGIKGYGAELTFQELLDLHGMSYDDLDKVEFTGVSDAADLLRDGHLDAIIGIVDAPLGTFTELSSTLGINVLNIPTETIEKLQESNNGYREFTINSGVYDNELEIQTFAVYVNVFINSELPDETAYNITKVINENKDKWTTLSNTLDSFSSEFSVDNRIGDMHPGAQKYYEEAGVLEN